MKKLLALLFCASSTHAATFGVDLYTLHDRPRENVNPGFYVVSDGGWLVGAYRNSFDRLSIRVAKAWDWRLAPGASFRLEAGAVSGYSHYPAIPYVVPSVAFGPARLTFVPGRKSHGVHLSVEYRF